MARLSFVRRRRDREAAIPPGALEEIEASAPPAGPAFSREPAVAADRSPAPEAEGRLPGADPGDLVAMLGRALRTGTVQLSAQSHRADPDALRDQILGALRRHYLGDAEGEPPAGPESPGES